MKISVIVCTFNRSHEIVKCLDSIGASFVNASPLEAEIVVVDNASTDNTLTVVRNWAKTSAFPVLLLQEPRKGLSIARNCGLRAAHGDLLFFTDDDCRMDKNYIAAALRHDASDTEPVLRGGRVELGDKSDLPVTVKTDTSAKRMSLKLNSSKIDNVGELIIGCNMMMRRTVADTVGFFDEKLGAGSKIPGAEDTDFVFRAYLAGITLEYVPDMVVYHFHGRRTVPEIYKLLCNYMLGIGALYIKYFWKHINFCRPFYWDFKDALKEILTGKMGCRPEFGFSYKIKVYYCVLGALKYSVAVIGKGLRPNDRNN